GFLARVDLLAQIRDVDLDDARAAAEVVAPDTVENLRLAHHASRIAHQKSQQLKLGCREFDFAVAPANLVALFVEGEVADPKNRAVVSRNERGRPANQAPESGDDLFEAEWFSHIVVTAGSEAGDAVVESIL